MLYIYKIYIYLIESLLCIQDTDHNFKFKVKYPGGRAYQRVAWRGSKLSVLTFQGWALSLKDSSEAECLQKHFEMPIKSLLRATELTVVRREAKWRGHHLPEPHWEMYFPEWVSGVVIKRGTVLFYKVIALLIHFWPDKGRSTPDGQSSKREFGLWTLCQWL